ncbi:Protein eva-1 C [Nymphon striatum]|nr:Protein eva-1 C [Nymphon striatum]
MKADILIFLLVFITPNLNFANYDLFCYASYTSSRPLDGQVTQVDCLKKNEIGQFGRPVFNFGVRMNLKGIGGSLNPTKQWGTLLNDQCTDGATVVNTCQEKQACKMVASPRTFGGDSCPGVRKLATIEHRCRPRFFKRKVICQGQTIKLKCPRGKRLAIFSAEFGRSQKHKVLECPLPPDLVNKPVKYCQASFATETVLKLCHGERRCVIPASTDTFGNPCQQDVNMYLRVEFTCGKYHYIFHQ